MVTLSLLSDVRQASSLLLRSNNRLSSFCWTWGSKHGFLTSFYYFICYFFILGFLHSHCFLVSLRLSWIISLFPGFSYLGHCKAVRCTCAPMFLALVALFLLEQDFCGTLVVDSVPGCFPYSHSVPKVYGVNVHWTIADHAFLVNKPVLILPQRG